MQLFNPSSLTYFTSLGVGWGVDNQQQKSKIYGILEIIYAIE